MAKDGTNRGGRRVRAGDKPDALTDKIAGGRDATVVVNDSVTREAITKDQMRKFLKFIYDDNVYCKYYEVVYILFHTGMRISEFCGLTVRDIDLEHRVVNIDHQLQRGADMRYTIQPTKTNAGTRRLPITEDVADGGREGKARNRAR